METPSSESPSRKRLKTSTKKFIVFVLFFAVVFVLIVVSYFLWPKTEKPRGLLVRTKLGAIRGHYLTSYEGNQYEAYEGIPYALPPIGQRRFKSPVPIKPWSDEIQATKMKPKCLQSHIDQVNVMSLMSEDCLYLNVYVPSQKKTNGRLAVIFYIHGGAFRQGGLHAAAEQYIIDYNVILVPIQYRLGPFGFLSTEDDKVPGNMGLKDQSTALRWTYDNIEAFGGDPKRITLIGVSAGGACAQLHYLSAWSRGLFHAGMSTSGTAFAPWALVEHSREKAIELGHQVNCSQEDIGQMVECMKAVPGDILVAAVKKLKRWWNVNYGIFGPVVENVTWSVDPFIDDYPSQILKGGRAYDVPWIVSYVSDEGLMSTAAYTNHTFEYVDKHWDLLAPVILDYTYTIPEEQHVNVARRIRKHYFGEKSIDLENWPVLTDLIGDRLFGIGTVNAAKLQATVNKSPVFFYYYTYRATDSISNWYTKDTKHLGVSHGDDTYLVMKGHTIIPTKSEKDIMMQRLLIKMWISVAYNGVPDIGVKWPRVAFENRTCLDYIHLAGPTDYKLECSNIAQSMFWNSIGFNEK